MFEFFKKTAYGLTIFDKYSLNHSNAYTLFSSLYVLHHAGELCNSMNIFKILKIAKNRPQNHFTGKHVIFTNFGKIQIVRLITSVGFTLTVRLTIRHPTVTTQLVTCHLSRWDVHCLKAGVSLRDNRRADFNNVNCERELQLQDEWAIFAALRYCARDSQGRMY